MPAPPPAPILSGRAGTLWPAPSALLWRGSDRIALGATTLLPFALLHGRGVADVLVCLVDALFLLRVAIGRDWAWTRLAWVRVAGALWLWLVLCTLLEGPPRAVAQAIVFVRLPLFAAACEAWALRDARARRWFGWVMAAAAAWIAVECWQQYLTGANLFGAHRFFDGALTGPFFKPHAGWSYLDVFFPAVLPGAWLLACRGGWRGSIGALALLGAATATMVLIGQRMPMLLLIFGLLLASLLLKRLRPLAAAALLLGGVIVALTPILSPPTYHKLVLHFAAQMQHFWLSDYGQIYLRALAMLRASPVLGLGVEGFRDNCLDPAYVHGSAWLGVADAELTAAGGCNIHPHNYWLEMATSGGVPAVACFGLLAALWLARIGRGLDPPAEIARSSVFVMLATLLWPFAASMSLLVVDAGGWVFVAAGWGLALAASHRQADARA